MRPVKPLPGKRGSQFRVGDNGDYRSIVTVGGPTFTSIANAASGALAFTFVEAAVLDKLVIMGGGVQTHFNGVSGANEIGGGRGLTGAYVTALSLNGDSLVSGYVAAPLFSPDCHASPVFGHSISRVDSLSITLLNESGQTVEYGASFSVR